MEDCWQQVTHRIFHDSQPLEMNIMNPQRQLDKWALRVQMEQPWRGLEWPGMEDCSQQRTCRIFHNNCPGKTRHVSPQGLLGNWPFDVQVDHPWRQIEWPRMEDHWHRRPITYSMTPSLESQGLRAATGHWTRGPWWYRWNTNGYPACGSQRDGMARVTLPLLPGASAATAWKLRVTTLWCVGAFGAKDNSGRFMDHPTVFLSHNQFLCGGIPDPQVTGSDVREKGYFAAWNSTATPKEVLFSSLV
ncbi:uncharacterized protein [Bos indicus]|uniref:Uncharacterized protein isoform X3 n=2 Tax=Bos indicus TaxID=9915 RepID=A0ABM4R920_BOSIN